jgi:molybdopterin-guanine dinucleotide biosynthesis protein B
MESKPATPRVHWRMTRACAIFRALVGMNLMKVFGFAGYSGSGKTTLIERLIPLFTRRGLSVSLIKHTHHGFDIDRPGKDSFRFRDAGAAEVLLAGGQRWALMHELRDEAEPTLEDQLARLTPVDLVLVEGFRNTDIPKIEVHRPVAGHSLLHDKFPNVIAVASDEPLDCALPRLDLNDPLAIAAFILDTLEIA